MNKILVAVTLVAGLLLGGQDSVAAQELSVVFVNTARILEEAPQAKAASERLEKEFAPRDGELLADQRSLEKLEDKLARDGAVMKVDERRKLEREILVQQRELKRAREAFSEDLNLRRNEEFAKLQREVADAISSLAKKNSYDLVFENGVVYASDRVDVTDQVIEYLKQQASGTQ